MQANPVKAGTFFNPHDDPFIEIASLGLPCAAGVHTVGQMGVYAPIVAEY